MINEIKLAAGFAGKDKTNALSNVCVKDGIVQGMDRMSGIGIEINTDLEFSCNADRIKAVLSSCSEDNLKMEIKENTLHIKSGRFRSKIQITPVDEYPFVSNIINYDQVNNNVLDDLKMLSIFSDVNDFRTFAQGVSVNDSSMTATNGYAAIKKTSGLPVDKELIIPTRSIDRFYATKILIDCIGNKDGTLFMGFNSGFLFTKTIDSKMPDIDRVISDIKNPFDLSVISDSIESISKLCHDNVIIIGDKIQNRDGDAVIDGFDYPECAFNVNYIKKFLEVADLIDLSQYPDPCPFEGKDIKGVISGIRL